VIAVRSVDGRGRDFFGTSTPWRSKEARLARGAIAGGAVDATAMVSVRLCPGTLAKVLASSSFVRGERGFDGEWPGGTTPARRAAAFVVRG